MRILVKVGALLALGVCCGLQQPCVAGPVSNPRSIDGSGNNLLNASWGAAGQEFVRSAAGNSDPGARYPGDGSGSTFAGGPGDASGLPNPREVSNQIFHSQGQSIPSESGLSNMLWQWGQFLDHDITLSETSEAASESAPIAVAAPDPLAPSIPFQRTLFETSTGMSAANPRQQLNSITSYIDASNVYGSDAVRAAALRDTGNAGRMKTSAGDLLPFNTFGLPNAGGTYATLFLAGDVRANEQVGLTAMHTLFVREHNRLAGLLADDNPTWNDEQLFQSVRKIVGAEIQAITYNEFLPMLLGSGNAATLAPGLYQYEETANATISNEFATSIYRFGHSMLPDHLRLAAIDDVPASDMPLAESFFRPDLIASDATGGTRNVEQLLLGLSMSVANEIDAQASEAIRSFLFGPPGAGGMDLTALNIQRGRDHGLPGYNESRQALGLTPALSLADITDSTALQQQLGDLYDSIDDIDSWVGMLAEDHLAGSNLGELATIAIIDMFAKLRDGDRYFYTGDSELFGNPSVGAVVDLASITLSQIVMHNTAMPRMPTNVFQVPEPSGVICFALFALLGLRRSRR